MFGILQIGIGTVGEEKKQSAKTAVMSSLASSYVFNLSYREVCKRHVMKSSKMSMSTTPSLLGLLVLVVFSSLLFFLSLSFIFNNSFCSMTPFNVFYLQVSLNKTDDIHQGILVKPSF